MWRYFYEIERKDVLCQNLFAISNQYIESLHYCKCKKNETCKFTICQKLCVMIPVEFKAIARSGPTSVICGDISDEDCPTHICDEEGSFYIKGKMVE